MTPYDIARLHLGLREIPGPEDHPEIMAMYDRVGHPWVEHDEVAWCAAFVGSCLEQAELRSTRSLTARSYLNWGVPVDLSEARAGDIAVFRRGSSSWQGHVAFFVKASADDIKVLGGNQADAVSIARFPRQKLLGIRRAGDIAPSVGLSLAQVQTRLQELGYHEVGAADGIMGSRTRSAILAFRAEYNLPLVPIVDPALVTALIAAAPRSVSEPRAKGVPRKSRILAASDAQIGLGTVGMLGSIAGQVAPALAKAEDAQGLLAQGLVLLGIEARVASALLPWLGAAVFAGVILYALKARSARIEDHRSGKTA